MALALLQVTLVTLGARCVGARLLRGRLPGLDPALRWALEAAIGLQVVSWAVFVLASTGALGARPLTALTGLLGALALVDIWRHRDALRLPRTDAVGALALLAAGAWACLVALAAALPPTGIDELIYHLEVPRRMLQAGGMARFTDNIYAYFPQGGDQLLLLGLGVAGESAARLFHAVAGVLLGLAIFGASRPHAGTGAASLGSLAFLTAPTVLLISSWAYVDLTFTLYGLLAMLLAVRVIEARAAAGADLQAAVLCGLMCGAAWTVKYTGLQLTLLVLLVLLLDHVVGRRTRPPAEVLGIGAVALAMALPFLTRNWWLTGWPLFPFSVGSLPLHDGINWDGERASLFVAWLTRFGGEVDRSLAEQMASAVRVYFSGRFDDLTAYDGVIGPVFLLGVAALWRPRTRLVMVLGSFWLLLSLYWAGTTTQVRFLLPAIAPAAVLLGIAAARFRLVAGLAVLGIAVGSILGVQRVLASDPWSYWNGGETRENYLARNVAGFDVYRQANAMLGEQDRLYLINMRTFGYLLDLPADRVDAADTVAEDGEPAPFPSSWRGDYVFQQHSLTAALTEGPRAAYDFLLGLGVTYLLIDERLTLTPQALDEQQLRALGSLLRGAAERVAVDSRDRAMSLWRLRPIRRF